MAVTLNLSHPLFDVAEPAHKIWLQAQCLTVNYLWIECWINLLHLSTLTGHLELVKRCLENGDFHVDIKDGSQRTQLFYVVLREQEGVVTLLLESGADSNAHDLVSQRPLHIACANESRAIVVKFPASGANIDAPSLATGSVRGSDQPQHVQLVLRRSVNINAVDAEGPSVVHRVSVLSIFDDTVDTVKILLNSGIDKFMIDNAGETPFHVSARYRGSHKPDYHNVLGTMLAKGFPADFPTQATLLTPGRVTALQLACPEGNHSAFMALLAAGANINHVGNRGRTALHWLAITREDITNRYANKIALQLLDDMKERAIVANDEDGFTAADIALETDKKRRERIAANEGAPEAPPNSVNMWLLAGDKSRTNPPLHELLQPGIGVIKEEWTEEQAWAIRTA